MLEPDKKQCFFRGMYDGQVPNFEDVELVGEQVCNKGSCTLRVGDLIAYVCAGGSDEPRQRIDEQVDPSCSILDVPHQADEDFARAYNELDLPLEPPDNTQ